jgi:hypothetical protein
MSPMTKATGGMRIRIWNLGNCSPVWRAQKLISFGRLDAIRIQGKPVWSPSANTGPSCRACLPSVHNMWGVWRHRRPYPVNGYESGTSGVSPCPGSHASSVEAREGWGPAAFGVQRPGRSKATSRASALILGLSKRVKRRKRRRFSGVSFRPGGTVFVQGALCPGSTSANPSSSWGPLPRIRHRRSSVGALGNTPPRSMRPYTSGAMPLSHARSLACLLQRRAKGGG